MQRRVHFCIKEVTYVLCNMYNLRTLLVEKIPTFWEKSKSKVLSILTILIHAGFLIPWYAKLHSTYLHENFVHHRSKYNAAGH